MLNLIFCLSMSYNILESYYLCIFVRLYLVIFTFNFLNSLIYQYFTDILLVTFVVHTILDISHTTCTEFLEMVYRARLNIFVGKNT